MKKIKISDKQFKKFKESSIKIKNLHQIDDRLAVWFKENVHIYLEHAYMSGYMTGLKHNLKKAKI